MPNLVGDSVNDAKRWGQANGISVSFDYEDANGTTIIAQSEPKGRLLKDIKSVTFTVGSGNSSKAEENNDQIDNTENVENTENTEE